MKYHGVVVSVFPAENPCSACLKLLSHGIFLGKSLNHPADRMPASAAFSARHVPYGHTECFCNCPLMQDLDPREKSSLVLLLSSRRVAASPHCSDYRHRRSPLTSTPTSCSASCTRDRAPPSSCRLSVLVRPPPPALVAGKHTNEFLRRAFPTSCTQLSLECSL